MKNNFLLGELFCGPGGMALGAKLSEPQKTENGDQFSISHVWGADKDINAIATYNANELGEGIECDAMNFVNAEPGCKHKTISDFERVTALAFGFPCNDFSLVGKQKGFQGKFGNLYKAGVKAIEYSNPKWFIAENVSGIHSANSGDAFKKILQELEDSGRYGYELTTNLYKFEEYGVPQYRHRYIIVGIRKDQKVKFKIPAPTHGNGFSPHYSVSKAFEEISSSAENAELTRQNPRVVMRLKFTPPWHNAWYLDEILRMTPQNRKEVLSSLPWYNDEFAHMTDDEIVKNIDYARLKCTKARMSHIYRRLDADRPSYTITGSGGGGTHVYHWKEHRALTNRERAKIQSFPDSFVFQGPKEQVRKQIGMAVPPEAAKIIFEAILKTFAGINYKSTVANYNL